MTSNETTGDTKMSDLKRCTCPTCKQPEKPATLEYFRVHKLGRNGLNPSCRDCERDRNRKRASTPKGREHGRLRARKYREAHREEILERGRQRYAANPERHRAARHKYRAENHEKVLASLANWRAQNRQHERDYRVANRNASRARCHLRRARKLRALPSWQSPEAVADFIATRWAWAAFMGVSESAVHLGHLVPLKGHRDLDGKRVHAVTGLHCLDNLTWQLAAENLKQGAKINEALLNPVNILDYDVLLPGGHVLAIRITDD
jgi:hypothetical protein